MYAFYTRPTPDCRKVSMSMRLEEIGSSKFLISPVR